MVLVQFKYGVSVHSLGEVRGGVIEHLCYQSVTRVSRRCHKFVIGAVQNVTGVLQGCCRGVTGSERAY
jgi:hypothetical protein